MGEISCLAAVWVGLKFSTIFVRTVCVNKLG